MEILGLCATLLFMGLILGEYLALKERVDKLEELCDNYEEGLFNVMVDIAEREKK